MELKQLYTDLILEYNKDKTNKRKIENPTVHEHGHNPSCSTSFLIMMLPYMVMSVVTSLSYFGEKMCIRDRYTAVSVPSVIIPHDFTHVLQFIEEVVDFFFRVVEIEGRA